MLCTVRCVSCVVACTLGAFVACNMNYAKLCGRQRNEQREAMQQLPLKSFCLSATNGNEMLMGKGRRNRERGRGEEGVAVVGVTASEAAADNLAYCGWFGTKKSTWHMHV